MKTIATIGSATRDCIIQSNKLKVASKNQGKEVSMPLGAKIELEDIILTSGGGGTNSAFTFARQGFDVSCFSKIGADASGQEIISDLKKEGIKTEIIQSSNLHTAYSVVLVTPEGRSIFVYRGAAKDFDQKSINPNQINADWLYITSLGGEIELLQKIINAASKKGIKTALNPGSQEIKKNKELFKILPQINILLLNKEEGELLSGQKEMKLILRSLNQAQILVVTKGDKGAEVAFKDKRIKVGIFEEKKLVDRTGAGDAFGSGFVSGFIKSGEELEKSCISEALRTGSANSTSVIEYLGAKKKILTKKEIQTNPRWQNLQTKTSNL